jgi:hypothetical protein
VLTYGHFVAHAPCPILRVYVDETGDRGSSRRSSPYFAFAAVLVADEDEALLRTAVSTLRRDFKVPNGKPLHWNEHVRSSAGGSTPQTR